MTPLAEGRSRPLRLRPDSRRKALQLKETKTFDSGVIVTA
jgi:hypothetical protein